MAKRSRPTIRHKTAVSIGGPSVSMSAHEGAGDSLPLAAWNPVAASADTDLLPDLETLMARSRDMSRNNGLMAGAVQTYRDNIVGATLRLSAKPDYVLLGWSREQAREWSTLTEAHFRTWFETNECDAGLTLNGLGLTLQALGGAVNNGDALALPIWRPRVGFRWNTRLKMVESDRLRTPSDRAFDENVRGGIKFDGDGAPVGYHILKRHPGDMLSARANAQEYEFVPSYTAWGRRRVIHLHDKERTGQSRGRPIVASVMKELHMAGRYASNELSASLTSSLIAAFLETDMEPSEIQNVFGTDMAGAWSGFAQKNRNIRQTEGAAILPLPPGAKLNTFSPGRPNQAFEAFMLASLRNIAAGMNMPYELLVKDFSRTSYSSVRAALLEAWRYFNGRRRWLSDYWLREVYSLWLEEAVNAGVIDAPDFYANKYAYSRCRFIFGGRGWVDPVKEAQAAQMRIAMRVSTLEQECAEQGLDWEEVLDQQKVEQDRKDELKLREQAANTSNTYTPRSDDAADGGAPGQNQEDATA